MIDTLIVEDDYHVSTIHAAYVKRVPGFAVVGHAATLASARNEMRRLCPQLVLLDLYLPDGHGLDLVRAFEGETARPISWSSAPRATWPRSAAPCSTAPCITSSSRSRSTSSRSD